MRVIDGSIAVSGVFETSVRDIVRNKFGQEMSDDQFVEFVRKRIDIATDDGYRHYLMYDGNGIDEFEAIVMEFWKGNL